MKHFEKISVALAILFVPAVIFAQGYTGDTLQKLATFEDSSGLLESLSLWATLIVAFVTTAMVWVGGRQMHGGVFGKVLTYFSVGMALVLLGFVTEVPQVQEILPALYIKFIHSSLYIIGYILMGIAASNLLKVIKGE